MNKMSLRTFLFIFVFSVSLFLHSDFVCAQKPNSTNAESVSQPDSVTADSSKTKSPRGAMLRSVFVPGWGQFYNGKWFKGILIAGTEIGLVANAVIQNQYAVHSTTLLEKEFYVNNRNLSFWWLAGAILYSAVDAYVDAQLYHFDESPDLSVRFRPVDSASLSGEKVWALSLKFKF
ncbi:MAG: hypothetical protein GXO75_03605 [Calditrichaeota bacterium]|nr:hypothetical protein [Calditrichota bacterium]